MDADVELDKDIKRPADEVDAAIYNWADYNWAERLLD